MDEVYESCRGKVTSAEVETYGGKRKGINRENRRAAETKWERKETLCVMLALIDPYYRFKTSLLFNRIDFFSKSKRQRFKKYPSNGQQQSENYKKPQNSDTLK